ncbi:MAG: exodeoxyribonuclease VII large subunit [Proteobacteria bacterium]|nr:exodeoxyribonuclease VII large subunit [Pseudomonadota bacterium]MDA1135990.1 exodeoxyribonuclease VII large subunit [Pseudomonadota bacterium]
MTNSNFEDSQTNSVSNNPVYSVGEFSHVIKKLVETNFSYVRIRGEISRPSFPGSGHVYFTLKDADGTIAAIIWKYTIPRLSVKPEEGMEVICTGKITTFAGQSKYQIIVDNMEVAGEGALLKMLEDRRKKLLAEGLFNPEHKKPIPYLPEIIAVITSPSGAVIKDILHRLSDRFPSHVYIWPVAVQGEGSAKQVSNAIDQLNQLSKETNVKRPDLIIVARGGGSLEDLWSFNEEIVVRSVFNSTIPIISAVGHETDTTLIDFVSDLRAPTPTGAAEKSVPVRDELKARVGELGLRIHSSFLSKVNNNKDHLRNLVRLLGKPDQILDNKNQKLDYTFKDLENLFQNIFVDQKNKISQFAQRLLPPKVLINNLDAKKQLLDTRFRNLIENLIDKKQTRFISSGKLLEAASFKRVLDRGFSLVMDSEGNPIKLSSQASNKALVNIKFADETRSAQLDVK